MKKATPPAGKITIAPEVLSTIAQLTTQSVTGVSRLSQEPTDGIKGILRRSKLQEGVYIQVQEDIVNADIYVILQKDVNVREVSRNIQSSVARAISEMVGMQVGRINIHIDDIDFQTSLEAS